MDIAIIGGGLGGAAAALSLLAQGFNVQVYEQARDFGEVGAGIQISPNASRILIAHGLKNGLDQIGVRPDASHHRRWDSGATLQRAPFAAEMERLFGAPHYQVHRADLLNLLLSAIPSERLHTRHRLVEIDAGGPRPVAIFEDGASVEADLIVGADGIRSRTREILFGSANPRFKNCAAYRGLIPAERVAHLEIAVEWQIWMGPGAHFVHYYVRGGELLNFVANVDHAGWAEESWTQKADVADAKAAFAGWHPQIQGILDAVDETFIWALYDRLPLPAWHRGAVVLLGDACHPMEPHMAQGASQAIEDGATLAACLKVPDREIPAALAAYQSLRRERTARVQGMASDNRVRQHMHDGPAQEKRDAEMARNHHGFASASVGWLYGHDARQIDYKGDTNFEARDSTKL